MAEYFYEFPMTPRAWRRLMPLRWCTRVLLDPQTELESHQNGHENQF